MGRRGQLVALVVLGGVGCASLYGVEEDDPVAPPSQDAGTDTTSPPDVDVPLLDAGIRCDPTKPFGTPKPVTELNYPNATDRAARLTDDELTVFFESARPGGPGVFNIMMATRANRDAPFNPPVFVPNVNAPGLVNQAPSLTSDQLNLYLTVTSGDAGLRSIHVATRPNVDSPFSTPSRLAAINPSYVDDTAALVVGTGLVLYFNRVVYDDAGGGLDHVWRASRSSLNDPFGVPVRVFAEPATAGESTAFVTADERTIYFTSSRGSGFFDIFVAHRAAVAAAFDPATPVSELNAPAHRDYVSHVTADGCRAYVVSERDYDAGGPGLDIYVAERPK